MPLLVCIALAMTVAQAKKPGPPPLTLEWQGRYDRLVTLMKKKDGAAVLALFHKDYTETSDGVVYGKNWVKKQLHSRMNLIAQFGQTPKVTGVNAVGYTAIVTLEMTFKTVRKEGKAKATYLSTSTLRDTWVKLGKEYRLYRSDAVKSTMTRNGKPFKPPSKPQ